MVQHLTPWVASGISQDSPAPHGHNPARNLRLMHTSIQREDNNFILGPELSHRQPLLSQPSRLNITVNSPICDETVTKFLHHKRPEKQPKSKQIDSRPPLPPVAKYLFGHEKRMSDTHDATRSGSRGRRSTKNETRWTTPGGTRKNRTIFTDEQHYALVAAYEADKYPTTIQKELLARQLGL